MPLCLSSCSDLGVGGLVDASFVGEHDPPDAGCDASFQTAFGFFAGLAFGDLLVEVSSPGAVRHTDLGDCDKVESRVQLTVTAARETVAGMVTAGDLDGGDTGVVGVYVGARES